MIPLNMSMTIIHVNGFSGVDAIEEKKGTLFKCLV